MINEEINLLCVIPTLGHGGAQKILTEVAPVSYTHLTLPTILLV